MASRLLHLRIDDDTMATCLDYIENKTSVSDAVRKTLRAFTIALRKKGICPTRTPEQTRAYLSEIGVIDETPEVDFDLREVIKHVGEDIERPPAPDFAAIARSVEEQINSAATPKVRETVAIEENIESQPIPLVRISLFNQERRVFNEIEREAPKDRFVEEIRDELRRKETPDMELFVKTAALEVAYSNLSRDIWGTDVAKEQIEKLVAMHDGSVP